MLSKTAFISSLVNPSFKSSSIIKVSILYLHS
nr:MAG TPA: hypothetical protein [Caudoviricetes sp.]